MREAFFPNIILKQKQTALHSGNHRLTLPPKMLFPLALTHCGHKHTINNPDPH